MEGDTLVYDIYIDSYVHNGDAVLFFFRYNCFIDGKLRFRLARGCAGFFTQEELDSSLGVVLPEEEKQRRANAPRGYFKPMISTDRTSLDRSDLVVLSQGRVADVFGPHYGTLYSAMHLPPEKLIMSDRVTQLDRKGGYRGLGLIVAQKDLKPEDWYFPCHFDGDEVIPGSLIAEGCVQLLKVYMLSLGLHQCFADSRFQPIFDLKTDVKVRGQITPKHTSFRYEVEITDLGFVPRPYVVADVLLFLEKERR